MNAESTLSERGSTLAKSSGADHFKAVLSDPYDPETNPDGFINMGTAENYAMTADVAAFTRDRLRSLRKQDFTYGEGPWGTARLRKAMAGFMTKYFNSFQPVDPEDLIVANGVSPLCEMIGFAIADPGDGILLTRPTYGFEADFGLKAGMKPVYTSFTGGSLFSIDCIERYKAALDAADKKNIRVRVLMLCNPHNPLGVCYPKETIIAIMQFCQKYRLHLLADEVYATSAYDAPGPVPFTSVLSFDSSPYIDSSLLHVMYGASKDLAGSGLRMGVMHIRNKELMRAMAAIAYFHWSGSPSQDLLASMLEDTTWLAGFIEKSKRMLAARSNLCKNLLDSKGIIYEREANAGFFLWIDLGPWLKPSTNLKDSWEAEATLAESFMDNKVFLTNGKSMSAERPGYFRIVFSQHEATLRAGLDRVFEVLSLHVSSATN